MLEPSRGTVVWLVSRVLPRLRRHASASEAASLAACQTVLVWVWDYGVVDLWWWLLLKHGLKAGWFGNTKHAYAIAQLVFWAQLGVLILIATAQAAGTPDANFYRCRSSPEGHTMSLLLFWLIDFGTWWGWSTVIQSIDIMVVAGWFWGPPGTGGMNRSPQVIAINAAFIIVLLVIIPVAYAVNSDAIRRAQDVNYRTLMATGTPVTGTPEAPERSGATTIAPAAVPQEETAPGSINSARQECAPSLVEPLISHTPPQSQAASDEREGADVTARAQAVRV